MANENEIVDFIELEGLIESGALSPGQWVIDEDGDALCLVDTHLGFPQKMWMVKAVAGRVGYSVSLERATFPVGLADIDDEFDCKHNHGANECGHCYVCGRVIAKPRPMFFEPEPQARELDGEECRGCAGPVLLAQLTEEDDLPLCNRHWNQWLVRFLNSDDAPGCSAHLISEPQGSESGVES